MTQSLGAAPTPAFPITNLTSASELARNLSSSDGKEEATPPPSFVPFGKVHELGGDASTTPATTIPSTTTTTTPSSTQPSTTTPSTTPATPTSHKPIGGEGDGDEQDGDNGFERITQIAEQLATTTSDRGVEVIASQEHNVTTKEGPMGSTGGEHGVDSMGKC